jgi:hypothetical protein
MKIFLSHAKKDVKLARQLADRLTEAGFTVWISEDMVNPGNWAKQVGKALEQADAMAFLLTRKAFASEWVSEEFGYAIGTQRFKGCVFTVLFGLPAKASKDAPLDLAEIAALRGRFRRGI